MSPVLVGALLGSTVAYLKKIGKIPYTLEESLDIIMGRPMGDDVTWNNDVEVIGDEVEWKAPAPKQQKVKFPRAKADRIVKKVEKHLKPYVDKMMACGSYRRGAQMIGDIDFVIILKDGYSLPEILPSNQGVNWVGDQKAQVIIDGEKVDFRVTTPEAWGATILYFTGPADFNIKYRWMAKKRGLKLSEYGLFDRNTDKYIAGKTENDIFTALGRPYKNPDVRKGFRAESTKMYLHPHGGWDRQIDILEEFPNAKNFDALNNYGSFAMENIKVINSMEELVSKDSYGKLCYINFPLTVYRGVDLSGKGMKKWTWQKWLEDDKMGTSQNMGIPDSQPTTLNIQEALNYARAGHSDNPNSDFELYAIDVQDYFVWLPRESLPYEHKNCNAKYQCLVCNRIGDYNDYKNPDLCSVKVANFLATEDFFTKQTYAEVIKNDYNNDLDKGMKDILGWRYNYLRCFADETKFTITCDNEQHLKARITPVIFILGGARYEDLQVIWDSDVNLFFEAPYQPNQSLEDYSHQDLVTSSVVTGDFTTDSLKYGFGPTALSAEDNYEATYGKEQAKIRRRLKNKIMKQAIMGTKAGQWSARKSQELKRQYEAACEKRGLRAYKGNKTQKQQNLTDWSRQKWGTASGKKSSKTGEPYFPAKAIEALKDRGLYAKAKRQKQAATKAGKQHARYSDDIREVVKPFRAEEQYPICPLCHGYIPNDKTPGAYPGAMSRVFENMEICSACGTAEAVGPIFGPMQDIMEEAKEQGLSGLDLWAYTISNVKEYLPKELYGSESFEAEYEPISIMEMDRYLRNRRFNPIDLVYRNRPVKEWVYERGLMGVPNHYVRVYTSINRYGRNQGQARDSGRDAIRVQVIYRDNKGETLVSAPKRVHRVGNWKNNLQKRLDVIAEELPKVMFDSRGEPMTLRKYKGNYFWGSRDYPAHKETRRYESESETELSWQVVVVADPQDNNFYQAYQKVIEADNYNEIWEIVELVDDLNLATNKIADTKFNERRIIVTVYTPGVGLTAKDDYWCEEFDEMLETL